VSSLVGRAIGCSGGLGRGRLKNEVIDLRDGDRIRDKIHVTFEEF
jgi:hypothetical protein